MGFCKNNGYLAHLCQTSYIAMVITCNLISYWDVDTIHPCLWHHGCPLVAHMGRLLINCDELCWPKLAMNGPLTMSFHCYPGLNMF
jgi:hypothetical protein